mgnify:CR=1 FL=1
MECFHIDESGYTGFDLLNAEQRFQGATAVAIEPTDGFVIGRDAIGALARENGLMALPSATNFVTIDSGRDGAYARRITDALIPRGTLGRNPGVPTSNRCIRVSAGTAADRGRR